MTGVEAPCCQCSNISGVFFSFWFRKSGNVFAALWDLAAWMWMHASYQFTNFEAVPLPRFHLQALSSSLPPPSLLQTLQASQSRCLYPHVQSGNELCFLQGSWWRSSVSWKGSIWASVMFQVLWFKWWLCSHFLWLWELISIFFCHLLQDHLVGQLWGSKPNKKWRKTVTLPFNLRSS